MKTALVLLLVIGTLYLIGARAAGQPQDLARELEDAKNLYVTGNFPRAATTLSLSLSLVIRSLELQPSAPNQSIMLLDAHLHLGLTYSALNDSDSARESFRAVLALDPEYQLDPDRYAPRIVSLFEGVRDEIEADRLANEERTAAERRAMEQRLAAEKEVEEPPPSTEKTETATAPSTVSSPPSTEGKSGSKLPLILGIAGGGAAAGVALA